MQLRVDVVDEIAAQLLEIDVAGSQHGGGVLVFGQGQQQMLERRVFVTPAAGQLERAMQGLFEIRG
ncbi:hypothetical protein D3C83_269090 [compost metagenome]